jgi:hypothetical protein
MVSIYGGSGGGGGFDYVQDSTPQDPEEGEEWYDTGADAAYVNTGTEWVEQTVTEHSKLSGVGADDHHSPPTQTGGEYVGAATTVRTHDSYAAEAQSYTDAGSPNYRHIAPLKVESVDVTPESYNLAYSSYEVEARILISGSAVTDRKWLGSAGTTTTFTVHDSDMPQVGGSIGIQARTSNDNNGGKLTVTVDVNGKQMEHGI